MKRTNSTLAMVGMLVALLLSSVGLLEGQVGRSQGVMDANLAAEKDLLAVPNLIRRSSRESLNVAQFSV